LPHTTRNATSTWQALSILREDTTPIAGVGPKPAEADFTALVAHHDHGSQYCRWRTASG
jgi:hypothetical protein